jgi:maltooligosyltrehalose trehalohydrolase
MQPGDGGLFRAPAPPFGASYLLSLDGGPPRPDPRSDQQAAGVHGPSRRLDHAAFRWRHDFRAPPLGSGLIYELHVGTFTPEGSYDGVAAHLDHLVDLGVSHVELMPVASFPGRRGWGYDGVALFAPHAAYGEPDDLKRLVDACHGRGLAVLLDVVYNHLGPDGNYLAGFGPYFTDRVRTPWGEAVNLDGAGSDQVRAFFIDNAVAWLRDYRFDGLRLDAAHALHDQSALPFLEELAARVDDLAVELGRPLCLIAESDSNDPRLVRPRDAGGFGLAAQWSDDFHHALHVALTGERTGYYQDFDGLPALAEVLRRGWIHDGRPSPFRGHRHGRPYASLSGEPSGRPLVGYLQTHDQVGNRARGERIGHLTTPGRLRIGAALLLLSPFTPMLFQGEEWAASTPFQYFTDHQSPELADAVRQGRRREFAAFGWRPEEIPDPQAAATFGDSTLRWAELDRSPHAEILAWYRTLSGLRRRHPAARDPRLDRVDLTVDASTGALLLRRGPLCFAANLGAAPLQIALPAGRRLLCFAAEERDGAAVLAPDGSALWQSADPDGLE